ncbi:TPA: TSUP family transporter [Neisseria meningitidis]
MEDLYIILALGLVAMIAGFIDAIAGGGGLITLPALLLAGIPPVSAIATNKLQAAAATFSFARKGLIDWKKGLPIAAASFVGGVAGALSVSLVSKDILLAVVPVLLIFVALYFVFSPKLDGSKEGKARMSFFLFGLTVAPLLGFYDGVFGPGVGSFFLIAFIVLLGCKLLNAMSYTKLANVACNLGSLSVFLLHGSIIFPIAATMAVGAFVGANLGARFAVRFGSKLIKPLLIVISISMAVKLLIDERNPLYQMIVSMF